MIRGRAGGPYVWQADRDGDHWHAYVPGGYASVDVPDGFRGRSLNFKSACAYILLE
jgi:hypothetical protein